MYEIVRSLEDCGEKLNWFRSYGQVQMVIKAPSGRVLALINRTNPGTATDAQLEAIRRFMQDETADHS